jgi:hypothetical protein
VVSSFEGSRIPDPGFPGDDGSAAPEVTAALASYAAGGTDHADALEALLHGRLLVPVVAVPGEVEVDADGLAHDKTSDMATVLITRRDGRRGMLAFTATATMAAWDPAARPVPVAASTAARAALQEGADALVVDLAGPVRFVIEGDDLRGTAEGWSLTRVGGRSAWIRPAPE